MSKLRKLVILLAVLVIAFPTCVFGYVYTKLKTVQDNGDYDALDSLDHKNDSGITNILLLGTDGRPGENAQRSDAMMILTVDNKNKSLKLTSLGRDTYVDIPGHGKQKLTHAYFYGKADLLIETIEENFKLDIHDYAQVDFYSFMDIINVLGGVTVDVQESELKELNKFIPETYSWYEHIHDYAQVDFYSFMDIINVLGGVTVDVQESELKELNKFIPETYSWYEHDDKGKIKYVTKFMDIINVLGGVTVDVQESELKELNKFIPETYSWYEHDDKGKIKYVTKAGKQNLNAYQALSFARELNKFIPETYSWYEHDDKGKIKYVTKAGKQNLNAYQALSFARIRKNDGTMERDNRQRMVIEAMVKKLKGLTLSKYNDLMNSVLPYVKKNMSPATSLGLA